MSFPFGGRSSFKDRTMGKSSDEIFDDMLKNINQRKKEFFESPAKWRSKGIFEDELGRSGERGSSRLKAHLGDLAARHPELATHLADLLPSESHEGSHSKKSSYAKVPKYSSFDTNEKEVNPPGGGGGTSSIGTQTGGGGRDGGCGSGLEGGDIKLRSTVPDMQTQEEMSAEERGQRSQSAPPQSAATGGAHQQQTSPSSAQSAQQRDEGVRIIPILTGSPSRPQRQSQPNLPRSPSGGGGGHPLNSSSPGGHHFSQQVHFPPPSGEQTAEGEPEEGAAGGGGGRTGPTVRHIPIFVEGRDEPLLPREPPATGTAASASSSSRGGCQGRPEQQRKQQQSSAAPPSQQQPHHNHQQHQQPPPSSRPHSQQQRSQQHQQQQSPPPPPQQQHVPPPPPTKPDPLQVVAEVVKEVEALSGKVAEWTGGKGRTDKEYLYLDEMLTRELLKLDNIETEGRDEVRSARKDAIKRIQAAISVLESKADSNQLNNDQQKNEASETEMQTEDANPPKSGSEPMETQSSQSTQPQT